MFQPGMSLGIPSQPGQGSGVLRAGRGARDRCPARPPRPIRGQQRPRDQCGMKELRLRTRGFYGFPPNRARLYGLQ